MAQESGTIEVTIGGMDCANCALGIERHLRRVGLNDARVAFATQSAFVTPTPEVPLTKVLDEIRSLGYRASDSRILTDHHAHGSDDTLGLKALVSLALTCPMWIAMLLPAHSAVHHALHLPLVQLLLTSPVFILACFHFGPSALSSLRARVPNMDVLIVIGLVASFGYSITGLLIGEPDKYLFFESTATIATLVFLGNFLERFATQRTSRALDELSKLKPGRARRVTMKSGVEDFEDVTPELLQLKDTVIIGTGEAVPADAIVIDGSASVDEAIATGESRTVERSIGEHLLEGTTVVRGSLRAQIERVGSESFLSQMIKLVREAQGTKPQLQRIADAVAAWFVPVVVVLACIAGLYSLLILGQSTGAAVSRAVAVLVISCPCALGLATPAAVVIGIGRGARLGILIRSGEALERLAVVRQVIFDKTGTLTTLTPQVAQSTNSNVASDEVLSLVKGLEQHSSHPIARALVAFAGKIPAAALSAVSEVAGQGISGLDSKGQRVALGAVSSGEDSDRIVLTRDGKELGSFELKEQLQDGAIKALSTLRTLGLSIGMLSGDHPDRCTSVANALKIETVRSRQTPVEKKSFLETQTIPTAFVGDGINDAPSLAAASVGISLSDASSVAMQAADVVLLGDGLTKLPTTFVLAKATIATIKSNLFWAFAYNIVAIPVAMSGLLSPSFAALAMGFSDVILVVNSLLLGARPLKIESH